ncbi:MAG: iron ABC transporter permease [Oscillatoriales cyanobacterium]|nr:MAG: iron ABC transporter permease [Oscillatoriales cyanobacterium]
MTIARQSWLPRQVFRLAPPGGHWAGLLWPTTTFLAAIAVGAPLLAAVAAALQADGSTWLHLSRTVLGEYTLSSITLAVGSAILAIVLGVTAAWLVVATAFPGRRWLEWALLLPLAFPAYLLAYVYTDLLDFYGPIQSTLRSLTGWEFGDYWFPPIRSLPGAILMMGLVLYPYVYMLARVAFLEGGVGLLEASRTLGLNPWQGFWRVALPMARPAIAGGAALVMMESLGDYGTVQFFSVNTFAVGIYRTWFAMGDRPTACQLSALLLGVVMVLVIVEQRSRGKAGYSAGVTYAAQAPYPLRGIRAIGATIACGIPLLLGFGLPAAMLISMAATYRSSWTDPSFGSHVQNTAIVAGLAALLAAIVAGSAVYGARLLRGPLAHLLIKLTTLGYAIPGSVAAVGVLICLGWLDQRLAPTTASATGRLLLSGTIAALVFAYLVRFLALALNPIEASLDRITPNLDGAAQVAGLSPSQVLWRVHLPMLRGGLLTALLLVFVDTVKELPATLIVRPFNFDTLAIRAYQLASDERIADAAGPALAIVAVGIVPVALLSWQIARSRTNRPAKPSAT